MGAAMYAGRYVVACLSHTRLGVALLVNICHRIMRGEFAHTTGVPCRRYVAHLVSHGHHQPVTYAPTFTPPYHVISVQ